MLALSKCTRFLGILIDSELYRFFAPPEKVVKLKSSVKDTVDKDDPSVRELASFDGKVMSMQVAAPTVRLTTAESYGPIRPDGDWDRRVQLMEAVLRELLQVVDWVSHFNKFENPIRRYDGREEIRITLDEGTCYNWRIDGQFRSLRFESAALAAAADWKAVEKQEWQPWNELLAVEKCLLLDCMLLSPFVPLWSVSYEILRTVPLIVDNDAWLFSIDLTNCYYQLFSR